MLANGMVLGIKPRVLCMLSTYSATKLQPQSVEYFQATQNKEVWLKVAGELLALGLLLNFWSFFRYYMDQTVANIMMANLLKGRSMEGRLEIQKLSAQVENPILRCSGLEVLQILECFGLWNICIYIMRYHGDGTPVLTKTHIYFID